MSDYVRLTEHNEWEGETWHFYVPVEGNEAALQAMHNVIRDLSNQAPDEHPYVLRLDETFTAEQVETLVTTPSSAASYLAEHNRMAGVLTLPDDLMAEFATAGMDKLYKGGLRDGWSGLTLDAECPLADDEDY